ncbi:yjbG [Symbiodinium microadriaticum]|nr:yjbG [Symbiodinium microadriaticum]
MSEAAPNIGGITAGQLRALIERIENLEEEKTNLAADIREVYAEAKSHGYDPKIMRQVIKIRKMEDDDRAEQEALLDTYLHAARNAADAIIGAVGVFVGAIPQYGNPFAGVREFPFGHPGLDLAADNPDLIDAMERLCGTADVEITKTDCWAKYAGAADYTQRHHRDLIYQSMVVPQLASDQHQYQAFFLLSDVTEDDAPLIMVPRDVSTDTPLWHDELPEDAYAAVEIPMTGPAGTLILFRTDSLHRGSNFKAANRSRFILFVDFQARGRPWDGKTHWAQRAWQPNWTKAITALSPRARCLFGFPAPSDPYWDDQTIRDVGARYPAMDMTPYKPDDGLWNIFPRPEDYFAGPDKKEHRRFGKSQFAGLYPFPYNQLPIERLTVYPDLVDAAERLLESKEIEIYKIELWAKYSGAINYTQGLHRDYGNHSIVVPKRASRHLQMTTFILLSDVTEKDGPTKLVPQQHTDDIPMHVRFLDPEDHHKWADKEIAVTGKAGSLLIYKTDVFHRGTNFKGEGRSRFALLTDFEVKGVGWTGRHAWPDKGQHPGWQEFMEALSPRERELFGFPAPGLPEWDLTDLYSAPDGDDLKAAFAQGEKDANAFAETYQGKIATLDGDGLAGAIKAYEALEDLLGRIGSFAGLSYARNMADPDNARFYGDAQAKLNAITTKLVFFSLELNRIEDDALAAMYAASPALTHYKPWIDDVRCYRPHQLSDELETFIHEKSVSGRAAWNRLFDETMADLRFDWEGEEVTVEEVLDKLSDNDPLKRVAAASSLTKTFKANERLFALITNTLAQDKAIEDRYRNYTDIASSRHLANKFEQEVVDALTSSVRAAYPRLSHRYYAMKAKWLGMEQMNFWDRNAPLPTADEKDIEWPEAKSIVLDAYRAFSPDMAAIAEPFFDKGWIDAPVRPGKSPGAFSHGTVPSAHPYILLNYLGKQRDVMTLAHELGHGVHQVLAKEQGALMADTPLTLAETASVFGEMLTFRSLLSQTTDPAARKALLASKVEDMLNTVVRQIAFYCFEREVHSRRRGGELTAEELGQIWLDVQTESLGPAIKMNEGYETYWCYIPHFIHSPFYVYAYAFGDCLVNSLYAAYEAQPDGFQDKYLDLLRAGGSKRHQDLLAPFGLNAADPSFWDKGLSMIEGFIDELETLIGRVARVGTGAGGLAAKMVSNRIFGIEIDQKETAEAMKQALGNLKGPLMKIAQMMATIPDAMPEDYAIAFAELQANAPPMGWTFVRRRMKAELGADWQSRFEEFEKEAAAAASLGQVHRATHLDGQKLAVKLQYPDMLSAVEADLKQMNVLFGLFRSVSKAIDTKPVQREIEDRLREELDYDREARHMGLYRELFKDDPRVHVPQSYPDLSTRRLLTMDWLEGDRLLTLLDRPLEERNQIAKNMFRAWWAPLAQIGIIHGDPHLGNYTARDDLSINLLDYGCIRIFSPQFVDGIINLYHALRDGNKKAAIDAYAQWGFGTVNEEMAEALSHWAGFIMGPLMDDRVRTIADGILPSQYGRKELIEVREKIRPLSTVVPPKEYLFLDRAAIGLGGVFIHLGAELNWHQLFEEAMQDYNASTLPDAQAAALAAQGLTHPDLAHPDLM